MSFERVPLYPNCGDHVFKYCHMMEYISMTGVMLDEQEVSVGVLHVTPDSHYGHYSDLPNMCKSKQCDHYLCRQ